MIRLAGIRKTYRMGQVDVHALRGVSLTIEPGEFVAIMGPSGSGKSTLMHVLGLLDTPSGGSYQLLGQEVANLEEDELALLRSQTIGFVFQQFNLLARTSALENVALPLLYSPHLNGHDRVAGLLKEVGLGERLDHRPNQLSGGQQQRVAIARALVNQPKIIFADEPTGNLDSASAEEIMGLLDALNARGITVILVTHESDIAARARRVIKMRDGVIQSDERRTPIVPASATADAERSRRPAGNDQAGRGTAPVSVQELLAHLRHALRSLLANKVRTGLSMLGILIGVAAVIAMLALGSGARQAIEAQLASMGSNLLVVRTGGRAVRGIALETGAVTRLRVEDAEAVAGLPHIARVAPTVEGRGQVVFGNKNWNTRVTGTATAYETMRAATPISGRFFTEDEERMRARVALVGMTLVRELFGGENPVGEAIKISKVPFQVIGVLPEKGMTTWRDQDDIVVIPLATAMHRVLGKDYLDSIDVEVDDPDVILETQAAIEELVVRRHRLPPSRQDTFEVRNMAEVQAAMQESSKTMSWLLSCVAAVSLLVGGIGIMNIMLVSVTERTREIGLRKAVGARRADILSQFLVEALVISLAGGAAGILLGCLITLGMALLAGWTVSISLGSVVLAVTFSVTIGVVFGLWPARKAAALRPIEALRYE